MHDFPPFHIAYYKGAHMRNTPSLVLSVGFGLLSTFFFPFVTKIQKAESPPADPPVVACNVSATILANPLVVCNPGETVNLSAIINGPYLTVQWEPAALVANPTATNTTATVPGTTTFFLTVGAADDANLIFNSNFDAGLTGFTSDYIPGTGGPFGLLSNEGEFAVATNPNLTHTNFASCGDHTGGGNMLVVNGAGTPNQDVWCQTVSVTPNTDYAFSAWVMSVVGSSPAQLQFSVNGNLLGNIFTAPSNVCNWVEFYQVWNSGPNSSVEICIVNQNTQPSGNDFALDDLYFSELCETIASVTVTVADLNANFTPPPDLCSTSFPIDLNTLLDFDATPGGFWSIDGVPGGSILDPTFLAIGPHTITYTVNDPPCMESVTHTFNITPPDPAEWAPPPFICLSSTPMDMFQWLFPGTPTDGFWVINGQAASIFDPAILGIGTHQVNYIVGDFPCISEWLLPVEVFPLPDASWTPPPPLCSNASAFLLDDLLDLGALPDGDWTIDGIASTIFDPMLLGNGTYSVTYSTGTPECQNAETHNIIIQDAADASWNNPGPLCVDAAAFLLNSLLTSNATTGGTWTIDGNPGTSFDPGTLGAGSYSVTYEVGMAPCVSNQTETIVVVDNPIVSWTPPDTLCANDPSLDLNTLLSGSAFSGGTWTVSSVDTSIFHPDFWGPGSFDVTYAVDLNGCSNSETHPIVVVDTVNAGWTPPAFVCEGDSLIVLDSLLNINATSGGIWIVDMDTTNLFIPDSLGTGAFEVRYIVENGPCTAEHIDTITITPLPDVSWTPPSPLCLNSPSLNLDDLLTANSDSTGYWTVNGVDTSLFHPMDLGVGMHTVSYTDTSTFCFNSSTDTIVVISEADASWTVPTPVCSGDAAFPLDQLLDAGATAGGNWTLNGTPASNFDPATWAGQTVSVSYHTGASACPDSLTQNIVVESTPIAAFDISATPICTDGTTTITFTGMSSANASFSWTVEGQSNPSTDTQTFDISWATPGTYDISLQVSDGSCVSEIITQTVTVATPLEIPTPTCGATSSDGLTISWPAVAGATNYIIDVLTGQSGTINGTMITFGGLSPGEEVQLTVEAVGPPPCGNTISGVLSCFAQDCPDVLIEFGTVAPICLDGTNFPILIDVTVNGLPASGYWSGPGIIDPIDGVFDPIDAGIGLHQVFFDYDENNCSYQGSTTIDVRQTPVATFSAPDSICIDGIADVVFTGTANPNAIYNWNFDGAIIISGSVEGPYQLSWTSPGNKIISLSIEDNGCTAGPFQQIIQVDPVLVAPSINCRTTDSSIEFFWPPVQNASGYLVNILSGPSGMFTSDTSYLVDGLLPLESVQMELTVQSSNQCTDLVLTQTCIAEDCPDVSLAITTVAPICLTADSEPFPLQLTILSGPDTGRVSWQGTGIVDTLFGICDPLIAGIGSHTITAFYRLGNCLYSTNTTLDILPTPVAEFELPDTSCITETAFLQFTGSASNGATYTWDFGGATATPGTGPGPHQLNWDTPGMKTIQLDITDNGCSAATFQQLILVEDTLQTPVVDCVSDYTTATFSWNTVANATGYSVEVLQGPAGTFINDTTYQFTGLMPDQTVNIRVSAESANNCANTSTVASCTTPPCPDISLEIVPVADLCWDGEPDTLSLQFNSMGDLSNGTLIWNGNGIIDPTAGIWVSDASMIGQITTVQIQYTESVCNYSASATIQVFDSPTATFTLPDSICLSANATATYTGTASSAANYQWDFGNANATPGSGQGPHDLSWTNEGIQTITLTVEENGCTSDTENQDIQLDLLLDAPEISCAADYTTITFSWSSVENADSYQVNVISGSTGMLLNDTTYQITGLLPDTEVSIEVLAISGNQCPDSAAVLSCSTLPCPDITLQIDPLPLQCFDGTPNMFQLSATTTGNLSNGILSWSGAGIQDAMTGNWQSDANMAGTGATVILTYTEDVCTYADTLLIEVFETPTSDFELPDTICISESALVNYTGSATSAATYIWDFGAANATPGTGQGPHSLEWPAPGMAIVSLQVSENSCTSTLFTQNIQIDPLVEAPELECSSTLTSITISWPDVDLADSYAISSIPAATGQWLSATSYVFENLTPGTSLEITVTPEAETSCPIPASTISCATLDCPETSLSWTAPAAICAGDEVIIEFELESTSPGPFTIVFSDGVQNYTLSGTSATFTPSTNTTFNIVSITDASATVCPVDFPDPISVLVNAPVEAGQATDPLEICSRTISIINLTDALSGADAGGSWRDFSIPPIDNGFNPGIASFTTTNTSPGNYQVAYIVEGLSPCPADTAIVEITINATPIADAGPDQVLDCLINTVSLGGTNTSIGGNLEYQWVATGGSTLMTTDEPFTNTTQPDEYELTVIDPESGCSESDIVLVTSDVAFIVPFASLSPISCFEANDGSIVIDSILGGTPPYAISLNDGPFQTGNVFGPLTPGFYDLRFRDEGGCESSLQFDLQEPDDIQVELITNVQSNDNQIELGDSVRLSLQLNIPSNAVDTVIWSPGSLDCKSCLSQTVTPYETSTYGVTVIDGNGCSASDVLTLFVRKNRKVFVPSAFSPNNDGNNDVVMVFAGQEVQQVRSFRIFSRWGETVFQATNFPPNDPRYGWDGYHRGQLMNSGVFVYFAEVEMIDGEVVLVKGDVSLMK